MKKILLLVVLLAVCSQVESLGAVTVDQTMSKDYIINSGYSTQIYNTMQVSSARATGKEYYSEDEIKLKKSPKTVKFFRKLYSYFDPAADDYSFYHHDSKVVPSYTDL